MGGSRITDPFDEILTKPICSQNVSETFLRVFPHKLIGLPDSHCPIKKDKC